MAVKVTVLSSISYTRHLDDTSVVDDQSVSLDISVGFLLLLHLFIVCF